MNIMKIADHRAVVTYGPDTDMLRGEFLGLNGGADFYASDVASLKAEGASLLRVFLQTCAEHGIIPFGIFPGNSMHASTRISTPARWKQLPPKASV